VLSYKLSLRAFNEKMLEYSTKEAKHDVSEEHILEKATADAGLVSRPNISKEMELRVCRSASVKYVQKGSQMWATTDRDTQEQGQWG
jgi:hypothetical protein